MIPALPSSPRATALVLAACAVLMVLVMLHHPGAGPAADWGAAHMDRGDLNSLVHGVLIALILGVLAALQRAADTLVRLRIDPRTGLLAFHVSIAAYVVAGSINGFLALPLAAAAHQMEPAQQAAWPLVAAALQAAGRYCAVFGSIGLAVALLAWGAPLAVHAGSRLPGIAGIAMGTAVGAIVLQGMGRVNAVSMTLIVVALALRLLSLAVWLWHQGQASAAAPAR